MNTNNEDKGSDAWDEPRVTRLATAIALDVAQNASVAEQLCFPHIYLGLKAVLIDNAAAPAADVGGLTDARIIDAAMELRSTPADDSQEGGAA